MHEKRIQAFKRLMHLAMQEAKWFLAGTIVLRSIESLYPLITSWLVKLLFDGLAVELQNTRPGIYALPHSLLVPLLLYAGVSAFKDVSTYFERYLSDEFGRKLYLGINTSIYKKLSGFAGIQYFEIPEFHNKMQMAEHGANQALSGFVTALNGIIWSTVNLGGFIGVMALFSPLLALVVILTGIPQIVIQIELSRQRLKIQESSLLPQRSLLYYGHVLSSPQTAKELRLFNLGGYFLNMWQEACKSLQATQRYQERRELTWEGGLNLISTLVYAGSFLYVVYRAHLGALTLGDVTFYTSAVANLQSGLKGLFLGISSLHECFYFIDRYDDLMALPQPIIISHNPRVIDHDISNIAFRGVGFRYDQESPWVLRNLDLVIPGGECLALVGENGAGKSTIVKLLLRLYDPTEGSIFWNGVDIRNIDPTVLRSLISAIFQDYVRYDLSARHNIGLGEVSRLADIAGIHDAAKMAGIAESIARLPNGYETVLSRRLAHSRSGNDLSGGEWQKLSLARMLMKNASLLILDEPTATLDARAENEIYMRFSKIASNQTTLLISHRFSTVHMAKTIAVLHEGRIVELGSHSRLMSRNQLYASLYRVQAEKYFKLGGEGGCPSGAQENMS